MRDTFRSSDQPASFGTDRFSSSGRLTPLLIGGLCLVILGISYERGKGNYHRLHDRLITTGPVIGTPTGPGGEEPIVLRRQPSTVSTSPEFVSATLLPGRGMNLLQLTANIPGHGEVPLLVSPPVEAVTAMLNGTGPDTNGALSTSFGGAFLVPWASRATGKPTAAAGQLQTTFDGARITFPVSADGDSTEGLLLNRAADMAHSDVMQDGQSAEATFHTGSFSGNWPSTADVKISAEMSGPHLDLTVTVQNTGQVSMPAAVGWKPHFAIPSGNRARASVMVGATERLEIDRATDLPDGHLLPVTPGPEDFTGSGGARLGGRSADITYTHLTTPKLADGPAAELRDTDWGFGIRVLPMSGNIRNIRVQAPADKPWVSLGPNMNAGDPFGAQWTTETPSGMLMLKPGESLTWKVRVELFSFNANGTEKTATRSAF